jgi:ABC-2 type transport system ATP-binding protein
VVWSGSAARLREEAPGSAYRLQTSDDVRARGLAAQHPGVEVLHAAEGSELRIAVGNGALDPFVLELGRAGVAVRRLELLLSPLESMFFALTGESGGGSVDLADLADAVLAGA